MLYTGKGDKGDTGTFGCNQRISKSSAIAEALGALDEINSFLGLVKVKAEERELRITNYELSVEEIVNEVQQNLFIIQAELAGSADKIISEKKLRAVEKIIGDIEKELPPIKSFFISGGTELSSLFDVARTFARRAERRVVTVAGAGDPFSAKAAEGKRKIGEWSLAYLNRLSSLLYALARYANHKAGLKEEAPTYK